MKFEDLFPFIIFLAYIGFAFLRRKAKLKKEQGQGTPPPETKKGKKGFSLTALFDSLKEELEKAALEAKQQKEPPEEHFWKDSQEEEEEEQRMVPMVHSAPPPLEDIGDYIQQQAPETIEIPGEPLPESHRNQRVPIPPMHLVHKRRCRHKTFPRLSRKKLKEAIVLSEILAKPVGLRE